MSKPLGRAAAYPLPFIPTSAREFDKLMGDYVWQDEALPAPNGGVNCRISEWYDDWHDAIYTARHCGARRLWASKLRNENGYYFQFPDGSRIWINTQGSQIVIGRHSS